jgi:hypothetical protein
LAPCFKIAGRGFKRIGARHQECKRFEELILVCLSNATSFMSKTSMSPGARIAVHSRFYAVVEEDRLRNIEDLDLIRDLAEILVDLDKPLVVTGSEELPDRTVDAGHFGGWRPRAGPTHGLNSSPTLEFW